MKSLETRLKQLLLLIFLISLLNSNWIAETELIASDGEPMDDFGCAVSISGNTLVVGSRIDTPKKQIKQ